GLYRLAQHFLQLKLRYLINETASFDVAYSAFIIRIVKLCTVISFWLIKPLFAPSKCALLVLQIIMAFKISGV
ncbi:MAG: hypothetical protein WBM99_15210, partial [Psychromonas sp.]